MSSPCSTGTMFSHSRYAGLIVGVLLQPFIMGSNTLAWKIPWTEEPGRLQSLASQRVGQD